MNNTVDIYVIGKYEYKSMMGTWIFYMNYKDAIMKKSGNIENARSSSRVTLYALEQALGHLRYPCKILIHSRSNLGFKNMKNSPNKDIMIRIQMMITKAGHEFVETTNFDNKLIDTWEEKYGENKNSLTHKSAKEKQHIYQKQEDKRYEEMRIKHNMSYEEMYSDLMGPSEGIWIPGSGGY